MFSDEGSGYAPVCVALKEAYCQYDGRSEDSSDVKLSAQDAIKIAGGDGIHSLQPTG